MENKVAFDVAEIISLIGVSLMGLLYFLLKKFVNDWDKRLINVEEELKGVKNNMSSKYVAKEDYREDMQEIKSDLKQIRNFLVKKI